LIGRADGTLRALLHQVERVHRRGELVARDEIGERLILPRAPGLLRSLGGLLEEVEGAVGRQRHGTDAVLEHAARDLDRGWPLRRALDAARRVRALYLFLAGQHPVGPGERILEERRRAEDRVEDAEIERLLRLK